MIWTRELLERLKVEHALAVKSGFKVFTFTGVPLLLARAEYLIECLETRLAAAPSRLRVV